MSAARGADGLTEKQARFVAEYLKTGNASEAYRAAYNAANMKPETIQQRAYELLKNGEVAARLAEARERVQKRAEITLESLTQDLLDDREAAREDKNHPAAIAATKALMELHGLKTGERKNERRPYEDLSDEDLDRKIEQKLGEAGYTIQ